MNSKYTGRGKGVYSGMSDSEKRNLFCTIYYKLPLRKRLIIDYIINKERKQKHRLHVVSPSPWPIYSAASAFLFVLGIVLYMWFYGGWTLIFGFFALISSFVYWFRDIIREGVYMGYHTSVIQSCLRLGFVLFLVSEVMFFFGFFWALFHYTLSPPWVTGGVWPPQGISIWLMSEDVNWQWQRETNLLKSRIPFLRRGTHYNGFSLLVYDRTDFDFLSERFDKLKRLTRVSTMHNSDFNYTSINPDLYLKILGKPDSFQQKLCCTSTNITINFISKGVLVNPYKIPLLNTGLLVTSGIILTLSHMYLRVEMYLACFRSLLLTIGYGLFFIYVQGYEYIWSCFAINDGAYASIFYMLTGFHGFHVIIGTIFLIVCLFRLRLSHFTASNHFAFEAAVWYWHFVDVIWILLYLLVYLWPNAKFFGSKGSITYFPFSELTVITINTKYFYQYCNQDPGFHFYAGINFELHYDLKEKVMNYILDSFAKDTFRVEQNNYLLFLVYWNIKLKVLLSYTHWSH